MLLKMQMLPDDTLNALMAKASAHCGHPKLQWEQT